MSFTPEQRAREQIERQLRDSGWIIQDLSELNVTAGRGVAVREFQLGRGYGAADYMLYGDRKVIAVVEAKKEGEPLAGVEVQTEKYSAGLPSGIPAWHRPVPFLYQSTGIETHFTNTLDPDPRSRRAFSFHQPETLIAWAQGASGVALSTMVSESRAPYGAAFTLLGRLRTMPPLDITGMWPAQIRAVNKLEESLADNRPRALIQMATGSGKTFTSISAIYRLLKFGKARRILFLVDRSNLAEQTYKEFQQYVLPGDGRKFPEVYNVQWLRSNKIDPVSRVCITTIQRLYSILKGEPEFDELRELQSAGELLSVLNRQPLPVVYNPNLPPEFFDFVFTDECHRSIYHLWRQALEYFDSYLIGLTATPSKQTLGFFNRNLVMEYNHAQAVADGVNVDFDVYRIQTKITEQGATVEKGLYVDRRDRKSRRVRWQELEDDLTYAPNQLDTAVVAEDQIRTVIQTFRDNLFTEIFPGRHEVPKTLVFAKDDSHADDIVRIFREEFGKGNDFCEKITYRTSTARIVDPDTNEVTYKSSGITPKDLLSSFRNRYFPRIAVTVDMIATGTDVKPLEIVFFMRDVKSANYFEQMKGREVQIVPPHELKGVSPDAEVKTRFVIVDAVGVCEREHVDNPSLERKPQVAFKEILKAVGMGSSELDVVSTLASRLARLDRQLSDQQRRQIEEISGVPLSSLIGDLVAAVDPDVIDEQTRIQFNCDEPTSDQSALVGQEAREKAIEPFLNPVLRQRILDVKQDSEQIIDRVSQDEVLFAGHSEAAKEKAHATVQNFVQYIETHRDEITAIQLLYSRPHGRGPTLKQLKELAQLIARPPLHWTPDALWRAYETLEKSKVHGSGKRVVADLVSLVRFALEQATILAPFSETVQDRFAFWMTGQEALGRVFTPDQRSWLEMIRDHIASSLTIEPDDFDEIPFSRKGGLGRAHALFGEELTPLLEELNEVLVV